MDGKSASSPTDWPAASSPSSTNDPLTSALARFVEALHRRYPEGPGVLQDEGLARRGNMPVVIDPKRPPAA
jgi:hypothetical protein